MPYGGQDAIAFICLMIKLKLGLVEGERLTEGIKPQICYKEIKYEEMKI